MNSIKHAEISARRRGGLPEDYIEIHQFIDSTKNICSDNRHRIFHTMWAVNEIVLPIFGHQLINSDGNAVDVKDLCEKDHLLVDFRHRFIPTLSDFVQAMEGDITEYQRQAIENIHAQYTQHSIHSKEISRLLLSPLALTGQLKSLLITHNSWFLLTILPRYMDTLSDTAKSLSEAVSKYSAKISLNQSSLTLQDFEMSGEIIFKNMRFESWMNHGADYPPSARMLKKMHSKGMN